MITGFARIACAIERCRLDTGSIPQNLESLVPGYLPAIPADVYSAKSFVYEPLPGGDFKLESAAAIELRLHTFVAWPKWGGTNGWPDSFTIGHQLNPMW